MKATRLQLIHGGIQKLCNARQAIEHAEEHAESKDVMIAKMCARAAAGHLKQALKKFAMAAEKGRA